MEDGQAEEEEGSYVGGKLRRVAMRVMVRGACVPLGGIPAVTAELGVVPRGEDK